SPPLRVLPLLRYLARVVSNARRRVCGRRNAKPSSPSRGLFRFRPLVGRNSLFLALPIIPLDNPSSGAATPQFDSEAEERTEGRMNRFHADCECGRRHPVAEGAAGGTIQCGCGRTLPVPSLRELRVEAGLTPYDPNPELVITHMLATRDLPFGE